MLKKTTYNANLNCFDNVIATIAKNEGLEFQLCLNTAWNFSFKTNATTIGNGINISNSIDFNILSNIHHLDVLHINKRFSINFLKELFVKEKYICPNIDTFYCYWDKCYNMHHNTHTIIIEKIDYIHNKIYISDPFYNIFFKELSFEIYNQMIKEDGFICSRNYIKYNISNDEIKKLILNRMYSLKNEILKIVLLSEAFDNIDISKEIGDLTNVWHTKLVYNFGRISLSRLRYCEMLIYIKKLYNLNLHSIINDLKTASGKWKNLQYILAKMLLKKDAGDVKYIKKTISNIMSIENNVCTEIISLMEYK